MSPTTKPSEFVTAEEIAERLGFSPNSINRWIASGWLPKPIHFGPSGRHRRWRRTVIEQFLAKLEAEAAHAQ
jgi:excisionase family DNA binding protein